MNKAKLILIAATAAVGLALASGSASAMPNGLPSGVQAQESQLQDVRWICGPFRCWWRPSFWGYRSYAFAGPRFHWGWRWRHRYWW